MYRHETGAALAGRFVDHNDDIRWNGVLPKRQGGNFTNGQDGNVLPTCNSDFTFIIPCTVDYMIALSCMT